MFRTTTLSAKSESFNDSPSMVCSEVSRNPTGRGTTAAGTVLGGGFPGRLAVGVVVVVVTFPFELQREIA
jgi:hypothetical protein